jgi:hypothetical protein
MNASTFLPVVCEATLRILSRYVLELSVNATILVGSFSRMMTRESAKICSEAELARQHLTSPHLTSHHYSFGYTPLSLTEDIQAGCSRPRGRPTDP